MSKIYNLLMGQLIVLWVFGALGWINLMNGYGTGHVSDCLFRNCSYNDFLVWFLPLVLVFYTIGWINNRKSIKKETSIEKKDSETIKVVIYIVIGIIILVVLSSIISASLKHPTRNIFDTY